MLKLLLKMLPHWLRQPIIELCRKQGIFFCKDLISLSIHDVQTWSQPYAEQVTVKTLTNETWVDAPAQCLPGDELSIFAPGLIKTEHIYLTIQNPNNSSSSKNKRFSLRNNHVLDEQRNVIYESDLTLEMLPIARQILHAAPHISGTVAYLSNTDTNNYYHWLCWILPQLAIYQQFVDLQTIDYFYLGHGSLSPYKVETLSLAGISSRQILQSGCTPDRILATIARRNSAQGGGIDHTTFTFIRGLFAPLLEQHPAQQTRRLYVKRGDVQWRRVLNETEVIKALLPYGFEPVSMDGKTVAQQAQLFAEAEVIVSVHGAALTNLMFAKAGTQVFELFPHDYFLNVYHLLASHAQADYYYMIGDRIPTQQMGNRLDILVNPNRLRDLLAMAGIHPTRSYAMG